MKRLTLVRHAKSDWGDPGLSDHDRPLNPRGMRAAPAVGKALAAKGAKPDLLLSSTALRAATTAGLIADELGVDREEIRYTESLYLASVGEYERVVAAVDETSRIEHLMTFGHTPGTHDFAHHLTGRDEIDRFVTCAVATIELDIEHWGEVGASCGRLVDFFTPHDL